MEVKVDLSGQQINDSLAKAILDSVIGDKLLAEVKTQVDQIVSGYHSSLKGTVSQEIQNQIILMLRAEYKGQIQEGIRKHFNDDANLDMAVEKVIGKLLADQY